MALNTSYILAGILTIFALAGCGGGSALSPVPSPSPTVLVALGDSITASGTYPAQLAALLGARLVNLGINGEFSGPTTFGVIHQGGVLADQVPQIPLNATIVTLYIGTNDMWLFGVPNAPGYLDVAATAARYDANIRAIVAGIRQRVPAARVILASVPNAAKRAAGLGDTATSALAEAMRVSVLYTGLPVADLENDSAMYDEANFGGPYDPHPNAAGAAVIAAEFVLAINGRPK